MLRNGFKDSHPFFKRRHNYHVYAESKVGFSEFCFIIGQVAFYIDDIIKMATDLSPEFQTVVGNVDRIYSAKYLRQ